MSDEGDCDKQQVSMRIRMETVRKTVKHFGRDEDGGDLSPAIVRALEEATRNVALSPKEYEEIAADVEKNRKKRQEKRLKKRQAKRSKK